MLPRALCASLVCGAVGGGSRRHEAAMGLMLNYPMNYLAAAAAVAGAVAAARAVAAALAVGVLLIELMYES